MKHSAVCLLGPTASGKTDIAIALSQRFPIDIISVDSALVYRHMNIGSAKPDAETLKQAPHALVDIREPEERYSVGEFVSDAQALIAKSHAASRLPLLVGGTMLYFRALTTGLAALPPADQALRAAIDAEAAQVGWPAKHRELATVDPDTAARLNEQDSQRIQRALEVYRLTGTPLSVWQQADSGREPGCEYLQFGLTVEPRALLHERIEQRLKIMVNNGLEEEVKNLMKREGLTSQHPSMRSVGYRQFWEYLEHGSDRHEAVQRTLFATRQLAKRQMTWMRSMSSLQAIDALAEDAVDQISRFLETAKHQF